MIEILASDEKGQALIEFALVFYVFMAVVFMLVVHGSWLYNNFQADRAARHGAVYISTTGDATKAKAVVQDYLSKTMVFANIKSVTIGSEIAPKCQVKLEMATFLPGIPKLLNSSAPIWVSKVEIVKEATAPGEDKFINKSQYN